MIETSSLLELSVCSDSSIIAGSSFIEAESESVKSSESDEDEL